MRNLDVQLRLTKNTRVLIVLALAITFLTALAPLWRLGSESEQMYLLRLAEAEENSREETTMRVAVL